MRESLQNQCKTFIRNRDVLKDGFKWENDDIIPICASLFSGKKIAVWEDDLRKCKIILEKETSSFSLFKANSRLPIMTMLIASQDIHKTLEKAVTIYAILKEEFPKSEYLSMLSILLSDMIPLEVAEKFILRGEKLYDRMKHENPLLTVGEDSVFSVLMAFSEKSDSTLVVEVNRIYEAMDDAFHNKESVQPLARVLSLVDAPWQSKCDKVKKLFASLKSKGYKYGKSYEITLLGALASLPVNVEQLAVDIVEVDAFLEKQKGYGFMPSDKKNRLMHAAMLVLNDYCDQTNTSSASVAAFASSLSMISARYAALCAIIENSASTASGF